MRYETITTRTPVTGGWTPDRKYRAETADGGVYFLRVAAPERAERLARAFRAQGRAFDLGLPVAQPLECGPCPEGFYTLEAWIEGPDARELLPLLPEPEQYAQGLEAGRVLKKLHSIPAPDSAVTPGAELRAKIERNLQKYRDCPLKYETDVPFFAGIEAALPLLTDRPRSFRHGDYHVGNFRFAGRQLTVIDFDRCDFGDPWEEFNRIGWCVTAAPPLACGMVDGYFEGEPVPEEFWALMKLYLFSGQLGSLAWAIPYGEGEIRVMRAQARRLLDWYREDGTIPGWYTEKWKKGEGFMTDETVKAILAQVSGWLTETPIQTERILLRPFREADLPDFLEYVSQESIQRSAGMYYDNEAQKREDFESCLPTQEHPPVRFAIEWRETGKVIGSFSLGIYPFVVTDPVLSRLRGVSLSCVLHEGYQRRGIMTEIFRAFLELALGRHDLDFVNAGYFAFNEASRRLQEKCGFRYWMDHVFPFRGREILTKEMLLTREEYRQGECKA